MSSIWASIIGNVVGNVVAFVVGALIGVIGARLALHRLIKSTVGRTIREMRSGSIATVLREMEHLGTWEALEVLERTKRGRELKPWFGGPHDPRWNDMPLKPVGAWQAPASTQVELGRGERTHTLGLPIVTGLGDAPLPWDRKAVEALFHAVETERSLAYLPRDPNDWPRSPANGIWRWVEGAGYFGVEAPAAVEITYIGQADFFEKVDLVRSIWPNCVFWVRIYATSRLLSDMQEVLKADPDVILLAGKESPLFDASVSVVEGLGITLLEALKTLDWSSRHIDERPGLVAAGSLSSPPDVLKALYLGANACALPVPCLWALTGLQLSKSLPLEPLQSLVLQDAPVARKLNEKLAGDALSNYLAAMRTDIASLAGALGMSRLPNCAAIARSTNNGKFQRVDPPRPDPTNDREAPTVHPIS